jgi:predicted signal transduction protein with EAL and GGDEF domain
LPCWFPASRYGTSPSNPSGSELKIDRGFARDLERDSDDAAIISATVAFGQALDLRIVAEGMGTEPSRPSSPD